MVLINRGWQFSVYDAGNGKIVKKYNTFFAAWWVMLQDTLLHLAPPVFRFWKCYLDGKMAAARSLAFVTASTLDKKIFGHPRIISTYEYEQEKVETLGEVLERVCDDEAKRVIDAFVTFVLYLYEHSMIEKNFNIARNFGMNAAGEIILIDLGEICTCKTEIQKSISLRSWAAADVVSGLPAHLRNYFVCSLDDTFQCKL